LTTAKWIPKLSPWLSGLREKAAAKVVDKILQLHGGCGFMNDHDRERFYQGAKVIEIYE
jgi:alkylation response protein AidB-like acyl-CoA dehydrogenase